METKPTTDHMKRGEFLRSLGLSSAALMSFYCLGTLTSCSSKSSDPTPTPGTGTTTPGTGTGSTTAGITGNTEASKGKIDFTIDLTSATYAGLKTVGGFKKIGDVLVVNAKGNKFVSLQRLCTHQQQDGVEYRPTTDDFECSFHGSVFALSGSVKTAATPGQAAMKQYTTTLSADGNSLRITE